MRTDNLVLKCHKQLYFEREVNFMKEIKDDKNYPFSFDILILIAQARLLTIRCGVVEKKKVGGGVLCCPWTPP